MRARELDKLAADLRARLRTIGPLMESYGIHVLRDMRRSRLPIRCGQRERQGRLESVYWIGGRTPDKVTNLHNLNEVNK